MFGFAIPQVFSMHRYSFTVFLFLTFYFFALVSSIFLLIVNRVEGVIKKGSDPSIHEVCNMFTVFGKLLKIIFARPLNVVLVTVLCTFIMAICVLDGANTTVAWAWKDILKGDAAVYNAEINERYKKIFEANGRAVGLKALTCKPHSLFYNDSLENDSIMYYRNCFRNQNIYFDEAKEKKAVEDKNV